MPDFDKFCKQCKNYEFNITEGILCKLTHKKPAFGNNCKDFILDPERSAQVNQEKTKEKVFESRHKGNKIDTTKYLEKICTVILILAGIVAVIRFLLIFID